MNKITPFFSVIIPVYQSIKTLDACLESVLNQDDDYEIVLVDDGSTDGSEKLCDLYKEKYPCVFTVIHKKNEGPLHARIDAIKKARGAYLMFLDADDTYVPGIFNTMRNIVSLEMPDMVIFNYFRSYPNGLNQLSPPLYEDNKVFEGTKLNQLMEEAVTGEWINPLWQKCIRRDLLADIDGFSKYGRMIIGEDKLISLSLLDKARKVVYVAKGLYKYYISSQSLSHNYTCRHYQNMATVHYETKQWISKWNLQNCIEKCSINKIEYGLMYLYSVGFKNRSFSNYKQLFDAILNDSEFWTAYEICKKSISIYKRIVCGLLKRRFKLLTKLLLCLYSFFN